MTAAPQLDLFAPPPAPPAEAPACPPEAPAAAPSPWAWHKDFVESDAEEGLHAWYATPRPGLWLHVTYDRDAEPRWAWRVERAGEAPVEGVALTKQGAQDAARAEAER